MHLIYGIAYYRRFYLSNLTANGTYLMAMTIVIKTRFVLGRTLKTMPDNQPQLHEELQSIVIKSQKGSKPSKTIG